MNSRELLRDILERAAVLPRTEIARVLVEPHKALFNLLAARIVDLREMQRIANELDQNPHFGMF